MGMSTRAGSGIAMGGSPDRVPSSVLATYDSYQEAQHTVDQLSDASFPVQNVQIVGRDVRLVERVTGRLTNGRAAAAGAGAGAWFGLFIGLLVGLFTTGSAWLGLVLGGVLIGAFWGAVFGFVAHWATRGQRDFASTASLDAEHYDVLVADAEVERARGLVAH
jgi:hypothetical protein